jgi:hypothetical protein
MGLGRPVMASISITSIIVEYDFFLLKLNTIKDIVDGKVNVGPTGQKRVLWANGCVIWNGSTSAFDPSRGWYQALKDFLGF